MDRSIAPRFSIGLVGCLGLLVLSAACGEEPTRGPMDRTGMTVLAVGEGTELAEARAGHTATLLSTGEVLLAGGIGQAVLGSAELYDPSAERFRDAGATLHEPRYNHTATPFGQCVLFAGGAGASVDLASAEIYAPAGSCVEGGPSPPLPDGGTMVGFYDTNGMSGPRSLHTATSLTDGRVLLSGGWNGGPPAFATAEIFDPFTEAFVTVDNGMIEARAAHTAVLLPSGKVLVAGGLGEPYRALREMELYDPGLGAFLPTASMSEARVNPTLTLLSDGSVLIAGGHDAAFQPLAGIDLYDPETQTIVALAPLRVPRDGHTTTLLPDGPEGDAVLFVGGLDASAEIRGAAGQTLGTATMTTPRGGHTATLLPGDRGVLLAGGSYGGKGASLASAELFDPIAGDFGAPGGPRCGPIAYVLYDSDGSTKEDCSPYRCRSSRCITACTSNLDCIEDYGCTVDGVCMPGVRADDASSGCGATRSSQGSAAPPGFAAAVAGLLAVVLRARLSARRGS